MSEDNSTTFRVETVDAGTVDMSFGAEDAASLRELLDDASTILACPDCGDLAPVTGGIPRREMPRCPRCEDPLHGVVEVTVVEMEADDE